MTSPTAKQLRPICFRALAGNALLLSVALVALSPLPGCGPANPLGRKPVVGKVTLDGDPLEVGSITFSPKSGSSTSSGAMIVAGEYAIEEKQGLPAGEYIVRINSATPAPGSESAVGPPPPGIERIAAQFNVKSTLAAVVQEDQEAVFNFETTSQ